MQINIVPSVFTVPKILTSEVISISRSKVIFDIVGDEIGFIYYVVADRYMTVPSFLGIKTKKLDGKVYNDSRPLYGEGYIKDLINYKARIEIGGLDT